MQQSNHRIHLILALAVALFFATGALAVFPQIRNPNRWQSNQFGWLHDYAAARATAAESGKPLMVVFRCVP